WWNSRPSMNSSTSAGGPNSASTYATRAAYASWLVTTDAWSTPTEPSWFDGLTITGHGSGLGGGGAASTSAKAGVASPAERSTRLVSTLSRQTTIVWNGQPV